MQCKAINMTEHVLKTGATVWLQEEDLRDAGHFRVLFQNVLFSAENTETFSQE